MTVSQGAGPGAALVTFSVYIAAIFGLAWLANRLLRHRSFLSEYFLGSRSLGVWAFALTFAATSASGGSFTGFPSKIYTHGWILALWIGSYMVVPVCLMGLLGKRLNQVARKSGAITVPDVLRDRFRSTQFGLLATGLIVFFMAFNLIAQFKAGSLILRTLLDGVGAFHRAAGGLGEALGGSGWLGAVAPEYLICLVVFGVVVVAYTTYGGFHAVVWTDVLQGIVMVVGVVVMLPLALIQVGGLEKATRELGEQTPPRMGTAVLALEVPSRGDTPIAAGNWVRGGSGAEERLFRLRQAVSIAAGESVSGPVEVLELTTPGQIEALIGSGAVAAGVRAENAATTPYAYGDGQKGTYVTGPGPSASSDEGFLPLSLAVSFFIMWAIAGSGQPSNHVRLMAFRNARTLRWSIGTVAVYYTLIYLPLVIIFCCARILLPGMEGESDRIMPAIIIYLTEHAGVAWLGGLLVAAPFAAVMSTVDSFLLMISSALVRDVYQRNLNPAVTEQRIRRMSYGVTMLVGAAALIGAVNPPQFLQDIIVYTGSGLAAAFLSPMVFALYWPRANATGCMAGMAAGFLAHLSLYGAGIFANGSFFQPVRLANMDPILFGLLVSLAATYIATRLSAPPDEALVAEYFYART